MDGHVALEAHDMRQIFPVAKEVDLIVATGETNYHGKVRGPTKKELRPNCRKVSPKRLTYPTFSTQQKYGLVIW